MSFYRRQTYSVSTRGFKPNSERPTRLNSTQLNWKTENRSVFCQSAKFWTFSELVELSWVGRSELGFIRLSFVDYCRICEIRWVKSLQTTVVCIVTQTCTATGARRVFSRGGYWAMRGSEGRKSSRGFKGRAPMGVWGEASRSWQHFLKIMHKYSRLPRLYSF